MGSLAGLVIDVHAGAAYFEAVEEPLRAAGGELIDQVQGLSFGRRLSWYLRHRKADATSGLAVVARLRDQRSAMTLPDLLATGGAGLQTPGMYSWWVLFPQRRWRSGVFATLARFNGRSSSARISVSKSPSVSMATFQQDQLPLTSSHHFLHRSAFVRRMLMRHDADRQCLRRIKTGTSIVAGAYAAYETGPMRPIHQAHELISHVAGNRPARPSRAATVDRGVRKLTSPNSCQPVRSM